MRATFYFVAWWEHDEPSHIMAGPFTGQQQAFDAAIDMRVNDGARHAVAISADIELHNVELLR